MTDLEQARKIIDECDRETAKWFEKRMEAVRAVAAYKKAHSLPITDPAREAEVIRRNAARVSEMYRLDYVRFLTHGITVSKQMQRRLLGGVRVAGCDGEAIRSRFPDAIPCISPDADAALDAVRSDECDCAVLPADVPCAELYRCDADAAFAVYTKIPPEKEASV